jgi:hypothetical protein
MSKLTIAAIAVLVLAPAAMGCRGQTSKDAPIFGIRNMYDQPRYDVQEESTFFADHRTMRPLVEGVVAREQEVDPKIGQGRLDDQSGYVLEIPKEVVTRMGGMDHLQQRGRDRYAVFCAPCHDNTGSGEGMVKKRAQATGATAFAPPTFHQERLRHMPDGQLFATISNGKSNMPPYAWQLTVDDRWAIVGYVRALQVASPKMAGAAPVEPSGGANAKTADAPKPAASGSAAPAASGSAAPAASGSAAPAKSAAPAPATSAKKQGGTP